MWMDNWVLNQPFHCWPKGRSATEHHRVLFRFFESIRPVVVLSSSNAAARETFEAHCLARGVPILQRRGGGGTVVLGPGCLVLTFAFFAKDIFANKWYFECINQLWADALAECGVPGIVMRGHSDLAYDDKKIAGTSLFRRKHLVVYQGSLLVQPDFELLNDLLQHPSREPDYRRGRSHKDFLISAAQLGYKGSTRELGSLCTQFFERYACQRLSDDFAEPSLIPVHQLNQGKSKYTG